MEVEGAGKMLFVSCLTSQQYTNVSQGWICSDIFSCYHAETKDGTGLTAFAEVKATGMT